MFWFLDWLLGVHVEFGDLNNMLALRTCVCSLAMLPESTQWSVVSTPVGEPGDEEDPHADDSGTGTEVASSARSWGAIWNCPYSEHTPSEDEDDWGNW